MTTPRRQGRQGIDITEPTKWTEAKLDDLIIELEGSRFSDPWHIDAASAIRYLMKQAAERSEESMLADKYQWLRRFDHFDHVNAMLDTTNYNTLDAAVDAAMKMEKK